MSTISPQAPAQAAASSEAFLIIEEPGHRRGGKISGRVLIGRRLGNHVVIRDPFVARIHAWIIPADGKHFVYDSGSSTGTLLNRRRVQGRHVLRDGDLLRVGPITLRFCTDPSAIAGIRPLDLTDRPVATNRPEDGQFIDCACGAPLWVPWDFAGKMGQCRYCGQTVLRRDNDLSTPAAVPQPTPEDRPVCGICQTPILIGESDKACESCGIAFHADCWTENRGCSSYGCAQVNVLDHANSNSDADQTSLQVEGLTGDGAPAPAAALPWEFLILLASVVGSVLGAWTFGVPALLAGAAALIGLGKRPARPAVLWVAVVFAAIGLLGGVGVSYFWWFIARHGATGVIR